MEHDCTKYLAYKLLVEMTLFGKIGLCVNINIYIHVSVCMYVYIYIYAQ